MNSQCSIELFGGIRVEQGKRVITRFRTQKTASLIAYLAFFGDRMHSREVLIDMLWPDAPSLKAGRTSLSVALSSLRNQLEPLDVPAQSLLFADRQSIGLSPLVTTDTCRFEKAVRDAERARSRKERDDEKRLLLTALTLYRDKLLPGYYEAWISAQQERLAEQYRIAVRRLSFLYEEDGDLDSAITCAQRAAKSDPSDEDVSQDLIRLLLKQDDPHESYAPDSTASATAVKQYRELEKAMSATGHSPSAKTRALVAPLLQYSPVVTAPAPVARRRSRLVTASTRGGVAYAQRESGSVFAVASTSQTRADQPAGRDDESAGACRSCAHPSSRSPDGFLRTTG
jgi:DNA-binding SARP family transcriptional activator